jgi:alpha-galactosidase
MMNEHVSLTVGIGADGALRMVSLGTPGNTSVRLDAGADTFITVDGQPLPLGLRLAGFTFVGQNTSDHPSGVELALTFALAGRGLAVTRHYVVYSSSPVVEIWTSVSSSGQQSAQISNLNAYDLALPPGTLSWLTGLQTAEEEGGPFTSRRQQPQPGEVVRIGAAGRSTETAIPWWSLDTGSAQLFGGLMWSGAWSAEFARDESLLRTSVGLPNSPTEVRPDRPLEMPHAFLGITRSDAFALSAAMRAFVLEGIRHGRPFELPVVYNTWFIYGTHMDEDQIRDEMERVAALGVEVFVLDAGWYLGAGRSDFFDFEEGLGSWQVDSSRFPHGLASLTEHAHNLGMRFGLWVEPERTSLMWLNQPGLAREEWLVTSGGRYDPGAANEDTKVGQLCLADERVRGWLLERLFGLIDGVRPDYLKWDNNRWFNCDRPGHGHGPGDGNLRQVEGLYTVLDQLRVRYPQMLIENVSGGGNRLDFAMLRYTDIAWMDDRSAPSLFVRHNLEGLGTVFPPAHLFSFIMGDASEPLVRADDLAMLARSRMPGVLGLAVKSHDLSEGETELLMREIAHYKRLRPILQDGSVTLLTPQVRRSGALDWDALQVTSATTGEAIVFAFATPEAPDRTTVRPQGLDPATTYRIESIDHGILGVASGADLMNGGIELNDSSASDAHILLIVR